MKRTATSRWVARSIRRDEKYPVGVTVDQQRQHHARVILRLARAAPIDLERPDINTLNGFDDEMRKVVVRDPIAKIGPHQKTLRAVIGNEISHDRILYTRS
jgi:hypothetical protein